MNVSTLVYTTYVAYNEITIIKFSEFRSDLKASLCRTLAEVAQIAF